MCNVISFPFSIYELDARAGVSLQHARHACATPVRDETSALSHLHLQGDEALRAVAVTDTQLTLILAIISFKRLKPLDSSS